MSLPMIIFFEQHNDTIPNLLLRDLLPDLADRGYTTLCAEAPYDLPFEQMKEQFDNTLPTDIKIYKTMSLVLKDRAGITTPLNEIPLSKLEDLIRRHTSYEESAYLAHRIRDIPAHLIARDIHAQIKQLSMTWQGVDLCKKDKQRIDAMNYSSGEKLDEVLNIMGFRDALMVGNLVKLRIAKQGGIIFSVGALHADGILSRFEEGGLINDVLYYFPHGTNLQEELNEIPLSQRLQGHTHCLTAEEITPFKNRIIKQIHRKIKYTQEIENNSHEQFLSDFFRTHFRAFVREGYHVDALVGYNATPNINVIKKQLHAVGVQTYQIEMDDEPYLVVPNVNKRAIAERIRTMV